MIISSNCMWFSFQNFNLKSTSYNIKNWRTVSSYFPNFEVFSKPSIHDTTCLLFRRRQTLPSRLFHFELNHSNPKVENKMISKYCRFLPDQYTKVINEAKDISIALSRTFHNLCSSLEKKIPTKVEDLQKPEEDLNLWESQRVVHLHLQNLKGFVWQLHSKLFFCDRKEFLEFAGGWEESWWVGDSR